MTDRRRWDTARTAAWRAGIALILVAIFVGLYQVNRAHPVHPQVPMPTAHAIGPGIGIYVAPEGEATGISCTTGFLVRARDGRPGLLAAGHCNPAGGPGQVVIRHSAFAYRAVGTFTETVNDGSNWDDYDIGLIMLDDPGKLPLNSMVDGHPVTGVASHVEVGDVLCHFGIRSGGPVCGPVVASETNKVRFEAGGTCGDSGGPVYRLRDDGTAEAVGIYIAVSDGTYSEPKCEDPHPYSIAQTITPWLSAWELTLDTAAGISSA
ncbi:hypothetical protein [Mycolicibacter longobardus]|uniref:Endopeptidase n=1 Tax=Mycolicibacter longobardus TaxID=1108812 RepID=A0A1X1YCF2_9MYCO|nr:hypothetical protein [Mycolicibacter longobardus]ORW08802.1 hypothetical protein AWC16_18445 [Mycolicibacter longobardus]